MNRTLNMADTTNDRDDGFSSIEFALLLPVAFVGVVLVIQVALWAHARNLAQAAVHEIALSRAIEGGGIDEASVVQSYGLNRLDGLELASSTQSNDSGADRLQVSLHGTFRGVLSFIALPVDATASVPVERFRP